MKIFEKVIRERKKEGAKMLFISSIVETDKTQFRRIYRNNDSVKCEQTYGTDFIQFDIDQRSS